MALCSHKGRGNTQKIYQSSFLRPFLLPSTVISERFSKFAVPYFEITIIQLFKALTLFIMAKTTSAHLDISFT